MSINNYRLPGTTLVVVVVLLFLLPKLVHADEISLEYKIKSAFLLNFISFVEWPEGGNNLNNQHIRLCLYGRDPFGGFIDQLLKEKSDQFGIRRVQIERLTRNDASLEGCNILFVPNYEKGWVNLEYKERDDLLIVGESSDFITQGGMFNFYLDSNKIRFEANLGAIQNSRLKISSQLLKISRVRQ